MNKPDLLTKFLQCGMEGIRHSKGLRDAHALETVSASVRARATSYLDSPKQLVGLFFLELPSCVHDAY